MKEQKRTFEPAEIKLVSLNRDLLLTSAGTLGENDWQSFNFDEL